MFCYLCCKGEGIKRKRCALCRCEIPENYFNDPTLLKKNSSADFSLEDGCQWFYEGRNGWWQYDERSSVEIEEGYQSRVDSLECLIAGHIYVVDFRNMRQHRVNQPGRFRRIKRDLYSVPKKGVAGLRTSAEKGEADGHASDSQNSIAPAASSSSNADGTQSSVENSGEPSANQSNRQLSSTVSRRLQLPGRLHTQLPLDNERSSQALNAEDSPRQRNSPSTESRIGQNGATEGVSQQANTNADTHRNTESLADNGSERTDATEAVNELFREMLLSSPRVRRRTPARHTDEAAE